MSAAKKSWLRFSEPRQAAGELTLWWRIMALDGAFLGRIEWFSRWRKYVFAPLPATVFEEDCLREIAAFCAARTREHRAARAVAKEPQA